MKTTRFYATINEAKQLMKLSIYEKWIKDKADMFWIHEWTRDGGYNGSKGIIDVGNGYHPNTTPAWSTDALIKILTNLDLLISFDNSGVIVQTLIRDNIFEVDQDCTCLPWMLVKALKEYDKKYGAK